MWYQLLAGCAEAEVVLSRRWGKGTLVWCRRKPSHRARRGGSGERPATVKHPTHCRCPIIGSPPPPEKSPRPTIFTGKNPPRPAAARAGRILPVNCRPGETFLEGRSYNEGIFLWDNVSNRWLSLPGRIFHGEDILMLHQRDETN